MSGNDPGPAMMGVEAKVVELKDGASVVIRPACVDDAEAILAFMRGMLPEARRCVMTTLEEFAVTVEQEREFLKEREKNGSFLLIAVNGEEIIGSLSVRRKDRKRLAHAVSFGMSIREAWRGRGLGSALLQRVVDWAEAEPGVLKISLQVFADNEWAIGLYRKFGFVEEGRLARETQREPGEFVDDLVMARFVKSAELDRK
jgi:RimJ/RimL family protein N-acetyltransferase